MAGDTDCTGCVYTEHKEEKDKVGGKGIARGFAMIGFVYVGSREEIVKSGRNSPGTVALIGAVD
jgi:hypothetical protein